MALTVLCVESKEEGIGVEVGSMIEAIGEEVLRLDEDDIIDTVDTVDDTGRLSASHAATELPILHHDAK